MQDAFSPYTLAAAGAALFCASFLRGFTGFGFGLAATPLLAMVLPPVEVVPVVLVLQVGSSFIHWRQTWRDFDRAVTWRIGLGAVIGTPLGTLLLRAVAPATARVVIALVAIAALAVFVPRGKIAAGHAPAWSAVPVGLLAGVLAGLCAMPGPPVIAWIMRRPMTASSARASMIVVFLATGCLALITGTIAGVVTPGVITAAIGATPIVIIGTVAGSFAFHRAPASTYRLVGMFALLAIAIGASVRAMA